MAVSKVQVQHHPQHWDLQSLGTESIGPTNIAVSQVNTTVQSGFLLPCNYKIVKVGIYYSAAVDISGATLINLVTGTGAYTAGNVAGNDNSFAPSFQPGPLQTAAAYPVPAPQFGLGYPTNVALAGTPVFLSDIPVSASATYAYLAPPTPGSGGSFVPPVTGATPNAPYGTTGFGWVSVATGGGYGVFLPADYDAVYPGNIPLTLRVATSGTGTLTNLTVTLLYEPMYLRPAMPGPDVAVFPGIDF